MAEGMPNKIVFSFLGNLFYFRLSYSISMAIKKNVKDKTLLPFPLRFLKLTSRRVEVRVGDNRAESAKAHSPG